jgi:hypothetical protein
MSDYRRWKLERVCETVEVYAGDGTSAISHHDVRSYEKRRRDVIVDAGEVSSFWKNPSELFDPGRAYYGGDEHDSCYDSSLGSDLTVQAARTMTPV